MDELLTFPHLEGVLNDYGVAVRNLYQDKLIEKNNIATGDLLNKVEFEVKVDGSVYEVGLDLPFYYKYVEEGVMGQKESRGGIHPNGGWKAYPALSEWIKVKPVIPRPMSNGKLPTQKQLAFLITRSYVERGTIPTHSLRDANKLVRKDFENKIINAFMEDIQGRLHTMLQFLITE